MPQTRVTPIKLARRLIRPAMRRCVRADAEATLEPASAPRLAQGPKRSAKPSLQNYPEKPETAVIGLACQVDSEADCVRLDYSAAAGAQFERAVMCEGIPYAHDNACKFVLQLNMHSHPFAWEDCCDVMDSAARAGLGRGSWRFGQGPIETRERS